MDNSNHDIWECDRNWASAEFSKADFGDLRLMKRVVSMAEDFSARPLAPINQASEDWAATKAAYRLLSNPKARREELFAVHRDRTVQRVKGEETLLAIQDTTDLNYQNHQACRGLGYSSRTYIKGVRLHSTLAVTVSGLPLGLLTQKMISRHGTRRSDNARKRCPIEQKESFRWVEALRETVSACNETKRVVTICDREGDIYEFLLEAERLQSYYVIRSQTDRAIISGPTPRMLAAVESTPVQGNYEVQIASREGVKGRLAVVGVRYSELILKKPKRLPAAIPTSISINPTKVSVVIAREVNAPQGVEPLHWVLLTNVAVESFKDAVERVAWYKARWQIETYHKILKSGCRVEDCRLEKVESLLLYLTLFSIIAWRIYWFTHINRTAPDAAAETVLSTSELSALSLLAGRKRKINLHIATARQAIVEMAKLGGFLARRHDGHPGPTVIWRGYQRLSDATEMYQTMRVQTYG